MGVERTTKHSRFVLEGAGLAAVLLLAGGLRLWNIDQNGHGNLYYAAAVRSMLASGTNFSFGSYDPAGFVPVDKPPAALWVQAGSAALFGYSGRSLLVPQALMGVASVLVTYLLVRRVAGLADVLEDLAGRGVRRVVCEGGPTLNAALLAEGLRQLYFAIVRREET